MIKPIKFESNVLENTKLSHFVRLLRLSVPDEFSYQPGQYVSLIVDIDGKPERRSYSIAGSGKGFIDICFNLVPGGKVSPKLSELSRGTTLTAQGPLGIFVLKDDAASKDNIFIATGTGIAPFAPMIEALLAATKQDIILLVGHRHEDDVLFHEAFKQLQLRYKNFKYHVILSKPSGNYTGDIGHVQKLIEKYIPMNFKGDFYLCGLFDMIKETGQMLAQQRKVSSERIIFERYD